MIYIVGPLRAELHSKRLNCDKLVEMFEHVEANEGVGNINVPF